MFTLEPLSQVVPEPVSWLWGQYLPRGKLAILDGDPGIGKSLVSLDLAARLSRGWPLPGDSALGRPQVTLLLSAEDRAADTIRPRAEAAGADLDKLIVVTSRDGPLMRFPTDIAVLAGMIADCRADLVVIDPVMAFLPSDVASSSDACVRGPLGALARVAERTDCAILLVRHLRKAKSGKAIHRGLGSIGIIGAVRTGLLVSRDPGEPHARVLATTKSNLAANPPALGFRLRGDEPASVGIEWTGPLTVAADSLGVLAVGPRDRAADWLFRELAGGPRVAAELYTSAAEAGIPERTLQRAKIEIRAKACLHYLKSGERVWYWFDPGAAWPKDAPFHKPHELPALEDL